MNEEQLLDNLTIETLCLVFYDLFYRQEKSTPNEVLFLAHDIKVFATGKFGLDEFNKAFNRVTIDLDMSPVNHVS